MFLLTEYILKLCNWKKIISSTELLGDIIINLPIKQKINVLLLYYLNIHCVTDPQRHQHLGLKSTFISGKCPVLGQH